MFDPLFEFIHSQYPQEQVVPLHAPVLGEVEKTYLSKCIDSGFVSSVGAMVTEFEQRLSDLTGIQHAIATVNGTAALHLGLACSGLAGNSEVIMSPLTFIATANAVSYCGATPVFVDIEPDRLGISPDAMATWLAKNTRQEAGHCINIATGRKVQGCLCMHTFGLPSQVKALKAVCREYGLQFYEDAAEALGSYDEGIHVGAQGDWSCLSFNGNKIVTTGGGGALLTNDESLAKKARHLATTAKIPHAWESCHDHIGFNFRMPNLNAALGCAQLERFNDVLADKRRLACDYHEVLSTLNLEFVSEPAGANANYWLNAVLCETSAQQQSLLLQAHERGIQLRPVWQLLSDSIPYADAPRGDLTHARYVAERLVNLPSSSRTTA